MTMLAEAQRRNTTLAAQTNGVQSQKEMLELSARYMPYLHPAFLMGRMSEYHTQQLLRNYPTYLQQIQAHTQAQQAQAARDYLMRADHQPGFEPGSKLTVGYNRLAQAYAQATLQVQQSNQYHLESSMGETKKQSCPRQIPSHMEVDQDEINVTDTDSKSSPEKTLDLSLKNHKGLRSPLERCSTAEGRGLGEQGTVRQPGHSHHQMHHLNKFSSPDRSVSTF